LQRSDFASTRSSSAFGSATVSTPNTSSARFLDYKEATGQKDDCSLEKEGNASNRFFQVLADSTEETFQLGKEQNIKLIQSDCFTATESKIRFVTDYLMGSFQDCLEQTIDKQKYILPQQFTVQGKPIRADCGCIFPSR
jgi:hypothetical protein